MDKLSGLEISTAMGCRLNCEYCPQSLLLSRYYENGGNREKLLSFEGFKKALENVEEGGFISFCGMVEPFHNPECADMIVFAYQKGYRIYLFTTLMGMTDEDFEKIKGVRLDFFELHIPDEQGRCHFVIDEHYKKMLMKMQATFDTYNYCCHGDVHHEIRDIIDNNKKSDLALTNRAGNIEVGIEINERKKPFLCCHGFYDVVQRWCPVMLPDGTLVACCNDYGLRHCFGNLITDSWTIIKERKEYISFRKSWNNASISSLCEKCKDAIPLTDIPAMKLKNYLQNNNVSEEYEKNAPLTLLKKAKRRFVWGAGAYFRDHYHYFMWDEALKPFKIIDQKAKELNEKYSTDIFAKIEEVNLTENDFVVVFVKNRNSICDYLQENKIPFLMFDNLNKLSVLIEANN